MNFSRARMVIAGLWLISSMLILTIVIIQTLSGKFEDKSSEVWGWLLSAIMPTLSLITTSYVVNAKSKHNRKVEAFVLLLTLTLSFFYIVIIFCIILLAPLTETETPLILMQKSNVFIGPIQGLVTALLGTFFYKESKVA